MDPEVVEAVVNEGQVPVQDEPIEEPVKEEPTEPSVPVEEPTSDEEAGVKNGYERKLHKLTTKAKEAETEAAYWRRVATENKSTQAEPAPEDHKPTFSEYNDIEAYSSAVADWTAQRAVKQALAARDQDRNIRRVTETYETRVQEFKKNTPDFDEVFADLDVPIAPELLNGILEAEAGPAVAYYLAKNLSVVNTLNNLSPRKQLIELGKLEERLTKKETTEPTKKVSSAPAGVKPPTASTASTKRLEDMTPDEFIRFRNKNDKSRR